MLSVYFISLSLAFVLIIVGGLGGNRTHLEDGRVRLDLESRVEKPWGDP